MTNQDTDFGKAFDELAGGNPPAEEPVENTEDQNSEPEDIWANAPDNLRQDYENVVRQRDDFHHRYRSHDGRVAAMQKQIDDLKKHKEEAPAVEPADTPSDDTEELFPEFSKTRKEFESFKSDLDTIRSKIDVIDSERETNDSLMQAELLTEEHPDWQTVATTQEFVDWVSIQPKFLREVLERNSASITDHREAATLISLYKSSAQNNKPSVKQELMKSGAITPSSKPVAASANEAPDDFDAAFEFYANQGKP